jgi:inhibitor of KinA sporulation pathway (predicted exonuclease)
MNYIVFDLEATCLKEKHPDFRNETIEIGATKCTYHHNVLHIIDSFDVFIKPYLNPKLSDFCMELTTITQKDVDSAEYFPGAIEKFQKWIGPSYLLCSWGDYDKRQFINDCILHGLDYTWTEDHFNLKRDFSRIIGIQREVGMKKALNISKLPLDGIHHRGIDDAINITGIFSKYFKKWSFYNEN